MDELDLKMDQLKKLIYADLGNSKLRVLAQQITKNYHTNLGRARAIYWWIKQNIHYVREPAGVDIYEHPITVVETGRGDCDKVSGLFAVLALLSGVPVQLKVITNDNKLWSHIFPLALTNGKFTPYDAAAPILPEQEVSGYMNARVFDV